MYEARIAHALERIADALESGPPRAIAPPIRSSKKFDLEKAKALYEQGMTMAAVARQLGVATNLIHRHFAAHGVSRPPGTRGFYRSDIDTNECVRLYEEGASLGEIANKFNTNPPHIKARLESAGVAIRGPGLSQKAHHTRKLEARTEEIRAMRAEGKTLDEIGKRFGITRERVRQVCEKNGIPAERPLTADQKQAVAEYLGGDSLIEVAERHNVHTHSIRNWVLREGYDIRPRARRFRPKTLSDAAKAKELYLAGRTIEEIRVALGLKCAGGAIYRLLAIEGVKPNRAKGIMR